MITYTRLTDVRYVRIEPAAQQVREMTRLKKLWVRFKTWLWGPDVPPSNPYGFAR